MKLWQKLLLGSASTALVLGAPLDTVQMKLLYSYQYPFDRQDSILLAEKTLNIDAGQPAYTDDDANNLISVSKFVDSKGNFVYQQIPDDVYSDMGKANGSLTAGKGGIQSNPTKLETVTLGSLLIPTAHAAIVRDLGDATPSTTVGTSLTWSHTVTGSNTALVVFPTDENGDTVTGVTYNAVSMGASRVKVAIPTTTRTIYIFGMVGPASGANNVVISRSGSGSTLSGEAISYTGVKQTGFPDATASNSNSTQTTTTCTLTTVANNAAAVIGGFDNGVGMTAGTNVTQIAKDDSRANFFGESATLSITPAGSYAMTLNHASAGSNEGVVCLSMAPVASGSSFVPWQFTNW